MKLLIDYNHEIIKLLKADIYTKEEVLLILEQALRNVVPDEVEVINEVELRRIIEEEKYNYIDWNIGNFKRLETPAQKFEKILDFANIISKRLIIDARSLNINLSEIIPNDEFNEKIFEFDYDNKTHGLIYDPKLDKFTKLYINRDKGSIFTSKNNKIVILKD
jgi:hypothetical protein